MPQFLRNKKDILFRWGTSLGSVTNQPHMTHYGSRNELTERKIHGTVDL